MTGLSASDITSRIMCMLSASSRSRCVNFCSLNPLTPISLPTFLLPLISLTANLLSPALSRLTATESATAGFAINGASENTPSPTFNSTSLRTGIVILPCRVTILLQYATKSACGQITTDLFTTTLNSASTSSASSIG